MRFEVDERIELPPERVFAAAADFANAPARISGIVRVEMLSEGPVGIGTRFRETRRMFGKEAVEEMTVIAFEPGRSYVLGAENHGCRYRSEIRVEPDGQGSRITMSFAGEPLTFFAKVMGFLMKPMMKSLAKTCGKDLSDLKRSLLAEG